MRSGGKKRSKRLKLDCRRPAARENDIYVTKCKRKFGAYCRRALHLLFHKSDPVESVTIHGLGAAILSACRVALYVQSKRSKEVVMNVTTSTVGLMDQVEKESRFEYETRKNSAISIVLYRKVKAVSVSAGDSIAGKANTS